MPKRGGDRDTYEILSIVASGGRNLQLQPREPAPIDGLMALPAQAPTRALD